MKVLDFGLAKLSSVTEEGPTAETDDERSTRSEGGAFPRREPETGRVAGTAAYMSPEQAEGKEGRRPVRRVRLRSDAL